MALKSCRECGTEVSTEAERCPHCGTPDPTGAKAEKKQRESKRGAIGCLAVLVVVVIMVALASSEGDDGSSPGPDTSTVDLDAGVSFRGGQFVIEFRGPQDCRDAELEVNSGTVRSGYKYNAGLLAAGETYTVGSRQFAKADGERFNPVTTRPQSFSIWCTVEDGRRGFYYARWQ